jgi:hypothetical protein
MPDPSPAGRLRGTRIIGLFFVIVIYANKLILPSHARLPKRPGISTPAA